MNNPYPDWWDVTITIYNKYTHPVTHEVSWYRHTIYGCFWRHMSNIEVGVKTTLPADNFVCRIPKQPNFLTPRDWEEGDKYSNFTLKRGDLIVYGNCPKEIDEYAAGFRSTDLLKTYKDSDGAFTVTSVTINTHTSFLNQHYFVRGD